MINGDIVRAGNGNEFSLRIQKIRLHNSYGEESGRWIPSSAILNSYMLIKPCVVDTTSVRDVSDAFEHLQRYGALARAPQGLLKVLDKSLASLIDSYMAQVLADTLFLDAQNSPDSWEPFHIYRKILDVVRNGEENFKKVIKSGERMKSV